MERKSLILMVSLVLLLGAANLWGGAKPEVKSDISISLHWDPAPPTWEGVIDGDIEGKIEINLIGANFDYPEPDPTEDERVWEFYWEEWTIETDDGTITAIQSGVWSFETFKFDATGPVVDATGKWEYLIGSTMYVKGVSSEFPVTPPTPVTGEGVLWID